MVLQEWLHREKEKGLIGWLFGGLQESIGAVTDVAKELWWEKMEIFGEQLGIFRDAFDQIVEKWDAVVDQLLSNPILIEKYNSFSHSSLLKYLWVSSLSSFLGHTFSSNYNDREDFSLRDRLEKQYLETLIAADPSGRQQHKKALHVVMQRYREADRSDVGKSLAEELKITEKDHPSTTVYLKPIVETLVAHQEEFPISPAIVAQLPNGSSLVSLEWHGAEKHYVFKKPLDRSTISALCLSSSLALMDSSSQAVLLNSDQQTLLRLFVEKHEGSNYSDVFAMTLFAYLRGMNTWHIAYDTDGVASEALVAKEVVVQRETPHTPPPTQPEVQSDQAQQTQPHSPKEPAQQVAATTIWVEALNLSKRLDNLTLSEGISLAKRVFGKWPATELLIALTKKYGKWSPALISRYIMLGRHEGRLQFGHVNSDPNRKSGQFNRSTFQLSAKPQSLVSKINQSLSSGKRLAAQAWIQIAADDIHHFTNQDLKAMQNLKSWIYTYSPSKSVLAQHDLLAHLWYTYNISGNVSLISQFADPTIRSQQLAALVSKKIQVGDPAIGRDVAFHLPNKAINSFIT